MGQPVRKDDERQKEDAKEEAAQSQLQRKESGLNLKFSTDYIAIEISNFEGTS